MTLGDSREIDFASHLASQGLLVSSGPFKFLIRSNIETVAKNLFCLYGDVSAEPTCGSDQFVDFRVAIHRPKTLGLNIYKQALFYLDNQAIFNPFPLHHATAMLEWGMNWCVSTQIHTYLIVHAAVIERNGLAAVLPAPPGSGKSTLCATLIQEGWRLLSDELTLIDLDNYQVVPVPRPVGLKNQSIEIIKQRYPEAILGVLSSDTLKGSVCHLKPPERSIAMQGIACPVGWVVFPRYEAGVNTQLSDKPKGQAFMEIANNAFNYSVLGVTGFEVLKNVIDRARCFSFQYSQLDEAIEVFANLPVTYEI